MSGELKKDVIIACDFSSEEETFEFLDNFKEQKPFLKIGMELFYASGNEIVRKLKSRGHKIFLDLKLHDIPTTVKKAMRVLSNLDVDMVNVHCAGTSAMMEAALEGLSREDGNRPLLIGVTQLTSTSEQTMQQELKINGGINEVIAAYARNAARSGLDGVVCSALEVPEIKKVCGDKFLTVTPGIRFSEGDVHDQKRVATPTYARELGSDFIVVGRAITAAPDPEAAYMRAVKEFLG